MLLKKRLFVPLGLFCLVLAVTLGNLEESVWRASFFQGLFTGLSLVLSIAGVVAGIMESDHA
ncbi:MAG: hypothetical protein JXB45_06800 [Candidatus Krumholzibacteriota bacterium]|nr:hypothetical protein [Candidatus Krumholzibacteriota bacterium]